MAKMRHYLALVVLLVLTQAGVDTQDNNDNAHARPISDEQMTCSDNNKCQNYESCVNRRCVDPCVDACGDNANCNVINHAPVCSCPPGSTGNPFIYCRRFDSDTDDIS